MNGSLSAARKRPQGAIQEIHSNTIPRGENTSTDTLGALASTSDSDLKKVIPVETFKQPSISTIVAAVVTIEGGIREMKSCTTSPLVQP